MVHNDEPSPSKEELQQVRQFAGEEIRIRRRRALGAIVLLVLSCGLVYLFLAGSPLHAYWNQFGKYLLWLPMFLLIVCVNCVGFWWSSWAALRDVEKEQVRDPAADDSLVQ